MSRVPASEVDAMRRRMIRMETLASKPGETVNPDLPKDPWQPRWKMETRWVTFECGCVAERCLTLNQPREWDPIIFGGLPQQAVYEQVCHRHGPGMNVYVSYGGYKDFAQWKRDRRDTLMHRTKGLHLR